MDFKQFFKLYFYVKNFHTVYFDLVFLLPRLFPEPPYLPNFMLTLLNVLFCRKPTGLRKMSLLRWVESNKENRRQGHRPINRGALLSHPLPLFLPLPSSSSHFPFKDPHTLKCHVSCLWEDCCAEFHFRSADPLYCLINHGTCYLPNSC